MLTDVQERAVRAGALDGKTNLLVVAPTSSGKPSLVDGEDRVLPLGVRRRGGGQLAVADVVSLGVPPEVVEVWGKYISVPFRALADEHYDLFRERYGAHARRSTQRPMTTRT